MSTPHLTSIIIVRRWWEVQGEKYAAFTLGHEPNPHMSFRYKGGRQIKDLVFDQVPTPWRAFFWGGGACPWGLVYHGSGRHRAYHHHFFLISLISLIWVTAQSHLNGEIRESGIPGGEGGLFPFCFGERDR